MQTFSIGTTIYTGADALQALRTICGGRVLIVTDRFFSENGKPPKSCAGRGLRGCVFWGNCSGGERTGGLV